MENTQYKNKWLNFTYLLPNAILTEEHISTALNKFQIELKEKKIKNLDYIYIQFKIKTTENIIRSISYMQTIKCKDSDFKELLIIFNEFWNLKTEEYHQFAIKEIILSYFICPKTVTTKKLTRSLKLLDENENFPKYSISGYSLPATMDITTWGNVLFSENYTKAIISNAASPFKYYVTLNDYSTNVEYKLGNRLLFSFEDHIMKSDTYNLNTFIRKFKNSEYYYKDSIIILKKSIRKCNFMQKLSRHSSKTNKFITMDLETKLINNKLHPICLCWYDGNVTNSFYVSDYKNVEEMLKVSITSLMKRKYNGYRVYIHNFSNFDSIFLLKTLSEVSVKINPIIRDGRFIDLKVKYGKANNSNNLMTLFFRDSLLILPVSLRKLTSNFNTLIKKGIFPYSFVNLRRVNVNYIGTVPKFKYFTDVSMEEYNAYCQTYLIPGSTATTWDLKKELIKYCEQDVISLYLVIDKFSKLIFNMFRIDIHKYPTLSSLALAIYRANFLGDKKIPLIGGRIYNDIKKAYTGGAVDVYRPKGKKIFRYDVNSLYPYVMKNYLMPVDQPVYFQGDITVIDKNAFGFFDVEVETPNVMFIPLLQTKVKGLHKGDITITPLGTWRGYYHSMEINEFKKYGYKFKIHQGYIFKQDYLFKEYVDTLYNLKVKSEKGSADYIIAKLLMNGLYGRFGMSPNMETHLIVNNKELPNFINNYKVLDQISLSNEKSLISIDKKSDDVEEELINMNISIPIAATVTACARIHMSKFKTMKNNIPYYSDTDSIDFDKPLETKYVGTELGKMKLEHVFDEAIYLAPKVYGGKTSTYEYIKIKGLKNPISFKELSKLLKKNKKLEIAQEKWYKNISTESITIKNEIYSLIVTENKRKIMYDNTNHFFNTIPLLLKDGKIVNPETSC